MVELSIFYQNPEACSSSCGTQSVLLSDIFMFGRAFYSWPTSFKDLISANDSKSVWALISKTLKILPWSDVQLKVGIVLISQIANDFLQVYAPRDEGNVPICSSRHIFGSLWENELKGEITRNLTGVSNLVY